MHVAKHPGPHREWLKQAAGAQNIVLGHATESAFVDEIFGTTPQELGCEIWGA